MAVTPVAGILWQPLEDYRETSGVNVDGGGGGHKLRMHQVQTAVTEEKNA